VLCAFSKVVKLSLPAHAFIVFLGTRYFRLAPRQLIIPDFISSTIFILVRSSTLSNGFRLTTIVAFFLFTGIAFIFLSLVTSYSRTRQSISANSPIYDGDVLTVYEQEDIAGFISGSQKEMNELINSLSE
jgi:hypothetical protein